LKIAILITGLIKDTYVDMYNHIIDKFNDDEIDFYLSLWDITGNYTRKYYSNDKNDYYISENKITDNDIIKINELFKPKELIIDNFDKFKIDNDEIIEKISNKSNSEYTRNLSTFSQYYKISQLKDKINDDYDIIIKTRFDLFLLEKIIFNKNHDMNVLHYKGVGGIGYINMKHNNITYEISDHIFYMKQDKLNIFFNFFNYLKNDLINEDFIKKSFVEKMYPEFLLAYYLRKNNINVINGNIKYKLKK